MRRVLVVAVVALMVAGCDRGPTAPDVCLPVDTVGVYEGAVMTTQVCFHRGW